MNDSELSLVGDFRLGDWLVQPSLNRISQGDSAITFELKWMEVLVCLAEQAGNVVTRFEIIDRVWATEFITDNTLTHTIAELRSALGDDANDPTYIETIRRRGYRLVAPVERVDEEGERIGPRSTGATAGPRWPHILAVGIAAIIAVLVILPPEALFEGKGDGQTDASLPRIVVLPFENLGPPDDEYFADGITEEIISRLAAISGLRVISRTSAMFYKSRDVPLRQIGDELDVSHVIEGTVRWERNKEGSGSVRINSQLIRVSDDTHLWSQRYDRDLEDIFAVQANIAEEVTVQLQATIRESERSAVEVPPTHNMEAYQAFLLGLQYSRSADDTEDLFLSVSMFERAVDLDPEFALAWASLAERHGYLYHVYMGNREEHQSAARRAVERAMSLEPNLPEGHRAMGYYHYFCHLDYEKALASFARVLKMRPRDTRTMTGVGYVLRRQGRWEESTEILEQSLALDPKAYDVAANLAVSYSCLRNFDRAEEYADLTVSLAPDKADGYAIRWDVLTHQGRYREARQVLEGTPVRDPFFAEIWLWQEIAERRFEAALAKLRETPEAVYVASWGDDTGPLRRALQECTCYFFLADQMGIQEACGRARELVEKRVVADPRNPRMHRNLGLVYSALGRKRDAIREGRKAIEIEPVSGEAMSGPVHVKLLAVIYARVGELDAAVDQIEYLMSIPDTTTVGELRKHPYWDPLRDHPRFQALLEKVDTELN